MGQDQVSGEVSVLCWLAAPVARLIFIFRCLLICIALLLIQNDSSSGHPVLSHLGIEFILILRPFIPVWGPFEFRTSLDTSILLISTNLSDLSYLHLKHTLRLLRTTGPVPFKTCICSNVETILSWACHVYGPFEFRTSLGTSILLGNTFLEFTLDRLIP